MDVLRIASDDRPVVIWTRSTIPWDGDVSYDGPLFDAVCYVHNEVACSLGCIAVDTLADPYCREVERELISEAGGR